MANRPVVEVKGLNEFRRDLRRADKVVAKELQADIKAVAVDVAEEASRLAPRSSGKLAAGYRGTAVGSKGVVRNRVFYARFIEFGFHPDGSSTFVEGLNPIGRAIEHQEDAIVDGVGDALESAAEKLGWH